MNILRGALLKSVGLGAKAVFVIFLAPEMSSGEFAKYFLVFTYALIVSRVLAMGSESVVAYAVKGNPSRSAYYLAAGLASNIVAVCLTLFSYLFIPEGSRLYGFGAAFAFALVANAYQIGALRSHGNQFQERRANIPWVFVCIFFVFFESSSAGDVFLYLILSYIIVGFLDFKSVYSIGVRCLAPSFRPIIANSKKWKRWLPVSLSTVGIAASLRSFPILISWFGFGVTDSLAYNFMIGEIVYQVCMVYVNQVQSAVSKQRVELNISKLLVVSFSFVVISIFSVMTIYVAKKFSGFIVFEKISLDLLLSVSLYCSTVAMFSFVRVFAWGQRLLSASYFAVLVQLAAFVISGISIFLFGMNSSAVLFSAGLNAVLVFALLGWVKLQARGVRA